jgi:hypothetical protein
MNDLWKSNTESAFMETLMGDCLLFYTIFSSKRYGIAWEHLEQRQVMGLVDSIAVEA